MGKSDIKAVYYFRVNQPRTEFDGVSPDNEKQFSRMAAKFGEPVSEFIEEGARQNPAIFRLYGKVSR